MLVFVLAGTMVLSPITFIVIFLLGHRCFFILNGRGNIFLIQLQCYACEVYPSNRTPCPKGPLGAESDVQILRWAPEHLKYPSR